MDSPDDDRIDEALEPLPTDLRALLTTARTDLGDAERLARVSARLGPALNVPSTTSLRPLWLGGGAVVVAGAIAFVLLSGTHRNSAVSAPSSSYVAAASVSPPTSASPTSPALEVASSASVAPSASSVPSLPASVPSIRASKTVAPPAASPSIDPIVAEHTLLAEARAALSTDPSRTLRLVAEHQAAYPSGVLSSEREFLRISALMRLGRREEASRARDRFVASWPTSAYRAQIDRLLEK